MTTKMQLVNVGWIEKHWGITHDTPRLNKFLEDNGVAPVKVTGTEKKKRWYIAGDLTPALRQRFKEQYPTYEERRKLKEKAQPQLKLTKQQQVAATRARGQNGLFVPETGSMVAVNRRLDAIVEMIQTLSTKFEKFAAAVGSPVQHPLFDEDTPPNTTQHN